MQYRDLVSFEPIESVVQLNWADQLDRARGLVRSYVISHEMADRLIHVVFPLLRFDQPGDNKGILTVGNYGTGKSHLMAVISAIAERSDLLPELTDQRVAQAAAPFAGHFRVVRTEIGDTEMPFRQIVTGVLENYLDEIGVSFRFPAANQIVNNKEALIKMMEVFQQQYPDQGLLLVVDELLEYLRGRRDYDLVRDLTFLRELGEVCADTPFRFIAGVQEAIFDNPRFSFAAETIRRVKDRFEQVHIARRDVKFVVTERLLKKTADQQAWIRSYLGKFSQFYGDMNERMDEFVRLFPIHPEYIDVFERITAVEKRQVLRAITEAMRRRLDDEVPEERPGLIAYDSYWQVIRDDPSLRAVPDIRAVIDCSEILEARIRQGFTRPMYRPQALRIIDALSVYRLAVGGIDTPLGPTPEELRDGLCIFDPLVAEIAGGEPAADLLTHVETVLREIHRTVSGQFVAQNSDNRQWYLDLKKNEDYDALIDQRAESLDDEELDRAYFDALKRVLDLTEYAQTTTFPLWQHAIEWRERKAYRPGWLFFGSPNDRSTAQPPLDFYLYFLAPYRPARFVDELRPDEVFFRIKGIDEPLRVAIRRYGAAKILAAASSGQKNKVYSDKADDALSKMTRWLNEHLRTDVEITCRGQTRTVAEWLQNTGIATTGTRASVSEMVDGVGSVCLAPRFQDTAPEYPTFTTLIAPDTRQAAAQDALRGMRGPIRTQRAKAALDALELLDGDRLAPSRSRYAGYILEKLHAKGSGQVLNRSELIQNVDGVEYLAPDRFRIEPEWVVVNLAALVYAGDVVLAIPGQKFDATSFDALVATSVADLINFKLVEPPKDWNLPAIQALFELVGLPPGNAQQVATGSDTAVQQIQTRVAEMVNLLVKVQSDLADGCPFWGSPLLGDAERAALRSRLGNLKNFLESLQPYTTPARLKNFRYSKDEVEAQRPNVVTCDEAAALRDFAAELGPVADYLSGAAMALPVNHPWRDREETTREQVVTDAKTPSKRGAADFRQQTALRLAALKKDYITTYIDLHARARLNANDDGRKKKLLADSRLTRLKRLTTISLLPASQLTELQNRLAQVVSCFALTEADLRATPICPHCKYQPAVDQAPKSASLQLSDLDRDFDQLLDSWATTLLDNLDDPTVAEDIKLLRPERRKLVSDFIASRSLPADLSNDFIGGIQEVLSGLVKIVVPLGEVRTALLNGGSPATMEDLEKRFKAYLKEVANGKEVTKVRVVVE